MKNIYVTWHYTTHGVAYLKHILSRFYLLETIPMDLTLDKLDQEKLNLTFDLHNQYGFVFDEVIYLTAPQSALDNLSSRRISYKKTILEDELVCNEGLKEIFSEIISNDTICYNLDSELAFVKKHYPKKIKQFEQVVWRNIQHYPIDQQIKWLTEFSNFKNIYSGKFKNVELKVDDLRNEKQISDEVSRWARQYFSKQRIFQPIINVSLGSTETQVVWHILSEAGQLPENTRFIKTYDDKGDKPEKRFKKFSIQEIQKNLISSISSDFKIYNEAKSFSRELVNKKMETFLKTGFSILLRGERGTGKSRIADQANKYNDKFITVNCASFPDDIMAEAELFGYEPGTFTGGLKDGKDGKFIEANGGVLFLDEIHHLTRIVQAKLMTAIQTKQGGAMEIWKLGSKKSKIIKCRLIFATNKSITELKDCLLPDFYDRIVQHVIEIPSLQSTPQDRENDWASSWKHLNFEDKNEVIEVPEETELLKWLTSLPLYGNWRDLEKIAMYYNAFNQFPPETKAMLNEKTAFQYAKNEFEKYHSPIVQSDAEKFNFNINITTKEMLAEYLFELQNWAVLKFKRRKSAVEHFNSKGDTVTEKTFNDWKNKRSLKNKD